VSARALGACRSGAIELLRGSKFEEGGVSKKSLETSWLSSRLPSRRSWLALAAVGAAALLLWQLMLWQWPPGASGADGRALPRDARRADEGVEREAEGERSATAAGDDAAARSADGAKAVSLEGSRLREQLEALARAEQAAAVELNQGAVADATRARLEGALERVLEPLLYEPDNLYRAIDMLCSGELAIDVNANGPGASDSGASDSEVSGAEVSGAEAKDAMAKDSGAVRAEPRMEGLSLAEYGAVRAIYWALLAYTAPESELVRAGVALSPSELLLDVVTALPRLRERVQRFLLVQLTEARLEGAVVLDKSLLGPILELRELFPEHRELFSALLQNIGESMTPEERSAVFAGLLDEGADATLVGITLGSLLRDDEGGSTLAIAKALYHSKAGDAAESARRKEAIVKAVAQHAADPFDAARFLAERSEDTRNMVEAYWMLGEREGGLQALEAQYHELSATSGNARARLALVLGMTQAPAERLLEIATNDVDAEVRGQAVLTLTGSAKYVPSPTHLDFLRSGMDSPTPLPLQSVASAAANLATTAKRGGESELAAGALELLRSVGADTRASERVRQQAAAALRTHLSSAEFEAWVSELRARGIAVPGEK
jgi:hypothetical protein